MRWPRVIQDRFSLEKEIIANKYGNTYTKEKTQANMYQHEGDELIIISGYSLSVQEKISLTVK